MTLNTVGPTIMSFGSEEQKQRFLPEILAGEVIFAIGYSEPEAGTDLAALRTKAVRDGDEYVINGAKVFTSGADDADWVWLACRTDADAKPHAGISLILVPTDAPGFSTRRSSRWAATAPPPPTTTTCGCRCRTGSAPRTRAGA